MDVVEVEVGCGKDEWCWEGDALDGGGAEVRVCVAKVVRAWR